MSKLYDKYLELKKKDESKMYLFRCGNFYIFLDDDAYQINEYVVLKITSFAKNVCKCGFPLSSLDNYLKVFQNHKLSIEVVEPTEVILSDEEKIRKVFSKLRKIKINEITPLDALVELSLLKEILDGNEFN